VAEEEPTGDVDLVEKDSVEPEEDKPEPDPAREAVVEALTGAIGSALVGTEIKPGLDTTIRVSRDAWSETLAYLKNVQGYKWLDFLSAIDWLPSPFGRDMEAEQDWIVHGRDEKDLPEMQTGSAGGDTRFQIFARIMNIDTHMGITIKADLPDDDVSIDSVIPIFAGVEWHEREAWEMFGIHFNNHPDLRALYLPTGFEGNPLRKDFPLLARRVKPWPGIVDVEPMPGGDDEEEGDAS